MPILYEIYTIISTFTTGKTSTYLSLTRFHWALAERTYPLNSDVEDQRRRDTRCPILRAATKVITQ